MAHLLADISVMLKTNMKGHISNAADEKSIYNIIDKTIDDAIEMEKRMLADSEMTREKHSRLENAGKMLCGYCESSDCEHCQVTRLLDDAYVELSEHEEND